MSQRINQPAIVIRKDHTNKDGTHPIQLYVKLDKKVRITLISVKMEDWDDAKKVVRRTNKQHTPLNRVIAEALAKANEIVSSFWVMHQTLTKEIFMREWDNPSSREDFIEYYEEKMYEEFNRDLIKDGTLAAEKVTLGKLQDYAGKLMFSEITVKWLVKFDEWMAKDFKSRGYDGRRQREKTMKHVKKYMNRARQEGKKFRWPWDGFKIRSKETHPIFLTDAELRSLVELYYDSDEILTRMLKEARRREMFEHNIEQYASDSGVDRIRRVMHCFLLQCFTGCRHSDAVKLTYENVEDKHIVYEPVKTRETSAAIVRLPITPMIRTFMRAGDGHLTYPYSNQKFNAYLKEVARLADIKKHLTSHVGRHTFATNYLARGGSLEVLQQLLGHNSIKTTMIYAHVTDERKRNEMMKVWAEWMK